MSKESVRSQAQGHLSPHSLTVQQHIPPVLITSSPNSGSRIIRQSSQPEASNVVCCAHAHTCSHTAPNMSLRQLRDPADGLASIAADSLRINGAMRPFRQVMSVQLSKHFLHSIPSTNLIVVACQICCWFWQKKTKTLDFLTWNSGL